MLFLVMMYFMAKQGRPKSKYSVFKRSDSGSYGVRFTLAGYPQFRIGLETADEDEAYEKASYIDILFRILIIKQYRPSIIMI